MSPAGVDEPVPSPFAGQSETSSSAAADDPPGDGENTEAESALGVAVEGQVAQPGVLQAADPVLAAGALPVSDFQVG